MLLPRKLDWEAHGKQRQGFPALHSRSRRVIFRTRALNSCNRSPSSRQRDALRPRSRRASKNSFFLRQGQGGIEDQNGCVPSSLIYFFTSFYLLSKSKNAEDL